MSTTFSPQALLVVADNAVIDVIRSYEITAEEAK